MSWCKQRHCKSAASPRPYLCTLLLIFIWHNSIFLSLSLSRPFLSLTLINTRTRKKNRKRQCKRIITLVAYI